MFCNFSITGYGMVYNIWNHRREMFQIFKLFKKYKTALTITLQFSRTGDDVGLFRARR